MKNKLAAIIAVLSLLSGPLCAGQPSWAVTETVELNAGELLANPEPIPSPNEDSTANAELPTYEGKVLNKPDVPSAVPAYKRRPSLYPGGRSRF